MGIANAAQCEGKGRVHGQEARFALDGFEDHRRHLIGIDFDAEQAFQGRHSLITTDPGIDTWVGQVIDRAGQYPDPLLVRRDLAIEVQGGQGTAMKAAVKGDDRGSAGGATGNLQGIFRRFGTTVGEHPAQWVGNRHKRCQALHQVDVGFVPGGIECVVRQACGLLLDRGDNLLIAMAQVQYANTANKINIAFALRIPHFRIFTVGQCYGVNYGDGLTDMFVAHVHAASASYAGI
ncbi:hypothetical protein D3C81_571580 [compost metagenome]